MVSDVNLHPYIEGAGELLAWLEEAEEATDVMELLDIMETLGDALDGSDSAEDFLREALAEA